VTFVTAVTHETGEVAVTVETAVTNETDATVAEAIMACSKNFVIFSKSSPCYC